VHIRALMTLFYTKSTKALYMLTALHSHCYTSQPTRGNPQGELIHFVSRDNRMRVRM